MIDVVTSSRCELVAFGGLERVFYKKKSFECQVTWYFDVVYAPRYLVGLCLLTHFCVIFRLKIDDTSLSKI